MLIDTRYKEYSNFKLIQEKSSVLPFITKYMFDAKGKLI
jgi:hypothetical protein